MFWQDLKIGFRKLAQKKTINALQIGGLAVGLAGFALVAQFVFWENSFDRDLPERERLFRINAKIYREGALNVRTAFSYLDLGPSLQQDFSAEIESFARLVLMAGQVKIDEKIFAEKRLCYTDAVFPSLFGLEMIAGDRASALAEPGAAMLSEKAALQFFGTVDCLGKSIEFESLFPQKFYVVRGVFRDQPANSHFSSRIFLSLKSLTETPGVLEKWAWRDFVNFVFLKKGASATALEQKMNRSDYVGAHWPKYLERQIRHELFLQNVADLHLGESVESEYAVRASGKTVRNIGGMGLFLLLVSAANFVLLALAKTAERGREIGVRKTIGTSKTSLLGQFFVENLPILSISAVLAALLFGLAQPFFETLTGEKMGFAFLKNGPLLASAVSLFFIVLGLACLSPAWAMARFQPVGLLRKNAPVGGSAWSQKGLVVFQFALAFFMIAATLTVGRQVEFLLARDIGLRLDQTVVLTVPNDRSPIAASKIANLKAKLLEIPSVRGATASMSVPGDGNPWAPSIRRMSESGAVGSSRIITLNAVDSDFLPAFGLKILAGRNFDPTRFPERDALILTETAGHALGYAKPEDALRERFICAGDTVRVVGVTSEYTESGGQKLPPEAMFVQRTAELWRVSAQIETKNLPETLAAIQKAWAEAFAAAPLEYVFLDQHFANLYAAEMRFGKMARLGAGLAILVACLGLFGIAILTISKRQKEIGIRKTLGATVASLHFLLAKDFLKLVVVAVLIASPVAFWAMEKWLADFAFRIKIGWEIFAVAGFAAVGVAFLTVSFQSIKAALADPVKSLRSE